VSGETRAVQEPENQSRRDNDDEQKQSREKPDLPLVR
jgi:hypothetical protein